MNVPNIALIPQGYPLWVLIQRKETTSSALVIGWIRRDFPKLAPVIVSPEGGGPELIEDMSAILSYSLEESGPATLRRRKATRGES